MPTGHRGKSGPRAKSPAAQRSQFAARARAAPAPKRRQRSFVERYRTTMIVGTVALLVVAFGVIFTLKFGPSGQGKEQAEGAQPVDPVLLSTLTHIPASTYDAVGLGSVSSGLVAISGSSLQSGGKPELLYIGAEYCPYCAAERWAMVAALSRFGTLSNLHTVRSASGDVFPDTATFTFYQSTYSSPYLSFEPVEQYTNQPSGNGYTSLENLSSNERSIESHYNVQPCTAGGIPFVDFGGKYVFSGATYTPAVLAGMDWNQIATQLAKPSSAQARGIIGSANLITAGICQLTGQQPAAACQSAGVQKAAALLGKGSS